MAIRFGPDGRLQSYAPGAGPSDKEIIRRLFRIKPGAGSGGGGQPVSSIETQAAAEAKARAEAEAIRLAAEKAAAEQKAIAEAQIAAAKTQVEKNKIAQAYIENRNAQKELKKILNIRANLIRRGIKEKTYTTKDINTGSKVENTVWTDLRGNRVFRVINHKTGEVSYKAFTRSSGGSSKQVAGLIKGVTPTITGEQAKFQSQLKQVEKYLPSGVSFQRDFNGNIISINDDNKGVTSFLSEITSYIPNDKLISAGIVTEQVLPKENVSKMIKNVAKAFSPKKWKEYREKQRQDYYDLYNLKGKNRNFYTLANRVTNSTSYQKNKLRELAIKDLKQDLQNNNVAIRAEAALVVATIVGGVGVGAAIGSLYKTPIKLSKEEGLNLENADWKQVAKIAGLEFGKEALSGYLFSKIFNVGGRFISKVPLTNISTKLLGQKLGLYTSNSIKIGLIKGLQIAYAGYLASLGTKGARTLIALKEKKYKTATGEASGILGAVVGINGERLSRKVLEKLAFLNPKYVKVVNNKYILRKAPEEIFEVKGKQVYLKERVQKPSIKRPFSSTVDFLKGRKPGQFKSFTKDPGLILKTQTVSSGKMPFEKQLDVYSNKEVTAVNAAADELTTWIRTKKMIRKPIDGEENAPIRIKKILNKFDNGKRLTINEIVEVSIWMKKNVAPNITLLERSLYADPDAGLRVSRLGLDKEKSATLRDILKNNFSFRTNKPQVLIFENAKIAKSPKKIRQIANKIKTKGLNGVTEKELAEIIQWQLTPSTKFKAGGSPIYAGGQELEITAYGSYIRRLKKVGIRYINGKKVTFVTAELWKPSKDIAIKIKKANDGKLNKKLTNKLEILLSKKLNQKIKIETPSIKNIPRRNSNIPILRIKGSFVYILPRSIRRTTTKRTAQRRIIPRRTIAKRTILNRRITSRRTIPRRITNRRTIPRRITNRRTIPRRITNRRTAQRRTIPRRITNRRTAQRRTIPRRITKTKIPIILPKSFIRKKLLKQRPTYYVVEKVRGKFKKLYPKPLTLKDARDYATYSIDNRLSRTAFFIPLGNNKIIVRPPKQIQGYYSKNGYKVRPYRIRYGVKKQLVNGFIEKSKYTFDKSGEKIKAKVLRKGIKRNPTTKRKLTPQQRRILLLRLKKARAARMRNLKGR